MYNRSRSRIWHGKHRLLVDLKLKALEKYVWVLMLLHSIIWSTTTTNLHDLPKYITRNTACVVNYISIELLPPHKFAHTLHWSLFCFYPSPPPPPTSFLMLHFRIFQLLIPITFSVFIICVRIIQYL